MPILLVSIVTSLARSLGSGFINTGEFTKWINLAINVIDSAVDVDGRLQDLETSIIKRLDKGEHFQESDFDEVVRRITARDERWANL